jgi:uroporphyrin-III C-methyltransferase
MGSEIREGSRRSERGNMKGKVYLVGAGPGDPELLTVKALRLLQSAEVVFHDELVSPEILRLVAADARVYNVGKRCGKQHVSQEMINSLLVTFAASGLDVVRLKAGDPLIFGRAGEEMDALRKAQIECEVVPGVTAALGAAARAQVPLTYRGVSSAVIFLTGHVADGQGSDWVGSVHSGATLAIYMPAEDYSEIARKLKSAGLGNQTPCAIISRVTTHQEQIHLTSVERLGDAPRLPAPALLLVGSVVGLGRELSLQRHHRWPTGVDHLDVENVPVEYSDQIFAEADTQVPHV